VVNQRTTSKIQSMGKESFKKHHMENQRIENYD